MTEHVKRYPSVASLAIDARNTRATRHETAGFSWYGCETAETSIARAISGDTARVPEAEKLLSQISAEIEVPERPWVADCAGAYPVVPEFLAGTPDCMRRRAMQESDASPVRIYVCVTSSGMIDAADLTRRGCAVLALVLALSRARPVELSIFNIARVGRDESVITAPINAAPLDLATAAYALTSPGFARRVCYGLAQQHHFGAQECAIKWPAQYRDDEAAYLSGLLRRLGGNPETDLIIGPATSWDALVRDPVAWVNAQVARYREGVA